MKRLALAGLAAAALVALPSQAQAQNYIGPVVGFHGDYDLGVGAYFSMPMPDWHENLSLLFDAEFWFPGEGYEGIGGSASVSAQTFAAGVAMNFPVEASVLPFAFGQLAYHNVSVDVDTAFGDFDAGGGDIGLHLGGGVSFGSTDGGLRPSAGARVELAGGSSFALFGALGFPLG